MHLISFANEQSYILLGSLFFKRNVFYSAGATAIYIHFLVGKCVQVRSSASAAANTIRRRA